MKIVMIQQGAPNGQSLPGDGSYLKSFDFEAYGGIGKIELTLDLDEAMVFPGMFAALAFYRTSPQCSPVRGDGKPNRPLTAANWLFQPVEENINE
jgi:hypothetical protein